MTPDETFQIRCPQQLGDREIQGLSEVLIDCVEGGDSIGFMLPISQQTAESFWQRVAEGVHRGERTLLAAYDSNECLIGTVHLLLQQPENQPHRADLTKMLVRRRARRRGIGGALLTAVERHARAAGKTLLVLDTASNDAERLYARNGWQRCGTIPDYALMPDGKPCATVVFFKALS